MNVTSVSSKELGSVADFLGLGTLADGEPGMDPELLRKLYQHARNEDGHRKVFERNPTFAKGWIDLNSQDAAALIAVFVPLDDADDVKHSRRAAKRNLQAQPWNDVLGIDSPPIKCVVKIHGQQWGLRFQSAEPTLRGKEILNENLPPMGAVSTPRTSSSPDAMPMTPPTPPVVPASCSAEEILRKAGMPS